MAQTTLKCLGFGLGAVAAIGATAATAGATVATAGAALPAILALNAALGSVAGSYLTDLCKLLHQPAARRFLEGRSGIDENGHVASVLRLAHLNALREVQHRFDATRATDHDPDRRRAADRFSTELTSFITAESQTAHNANFHNPTNLAEDERRLRDDVLNTLPATFDQGLAARRATGDATTIVQTLAEIRLRTATLDEPLPPAFQWAFDGTGYPDSWFDLFIRDAAEKITAIPAFGDIWKTEQRSLIRAIADAHTAALKEIAEGVRRIESDLADLKASVDHRTQNLSLSEAAKTELAVTLAKILQEQSGTVALVSGFLETIVGRQVPPDQWPATLFRVAADWKSAGERIDALSASRNLSPRIATLKAEAQGAHQAGRLDAANTALAEIDRIQSAALDRLEDHEREVQQERRLLRTNIAEARAAQAGLARARLAYREAAAHHRAAAQAIAPVDAREEWRYLLECASALDDLGLEFGDNTALVEAIAVYRTEVLPRAPRDRVPLGWAMTQNNLGLALATLGARESGPARLEEAVTAYRAALEEWTHDHIPLNWAATQNNLGNALATLGARESGTARLEEAVAAYRAALEERTRDRVPLEWAITQNNLGNALATLGARKSGTAQLEQAVAAYRAALEERTRERVPLDWAMTQNNFGSALRTPGERESSTARLEEAVAACRAALLEYTRDRVPLNWAATQNNLGAALQTLGERESGTARLQEAVDAYRAALEERTRDRVPLDWAATQNNLGAALRTLGERESGTARLQEAVAAYRAALEERTRDRVPLDWAMSTGNQGVALILLADRTNDPALAATALDQITTAFTVLRDGGHAASAATLEQKLPSARAVVARLSHA